MRIFLILLFCVGLTACATSLENTLRFSEAQNSEDILSLPIRQQKYGLILVDNIQIERRPLTFIIDTGATRSAIFENALNEIYETTSLSEEITVHGMLESGRRHVATIPDFKLGKRHYKDMPLVVLGDKAAFMRDVEKHDQYDGLIGMDILSDYTLYLSAKDDKLRLIPSNVEVEIPNSWDTVKLVQNPFKSDRHDLHYTTVRIDRQDVKVLIDTGSEFSVMNWSAASFPVVKSHHKRMKKKWELAGANGKFSPAIKLRVEHFESGQKDWFEKDFIIMDLKGLDVLGVGEKPFIIGGVSLFAEETFLFDFKRDVLAFKPKPSELKFRTKVSSTRATRLPSVDY